MLPDLESLKEEFPNYVEGHQYALDIMAGEIPACFFVKSAAERFIRDFNRVEFYMNFSRAERVIEYCQKFKHLKGDLAGTRIVYEPWQKFILINVFGWHWHESDKRRFTRAYLEIPRKNGKSTFSCPIGLYMTTGDKEGGAEVYAAASSEKQAEIVFNVSKKMALKNKAYMRKTGVEVLKKSIFHNRSFSAFQLLHSRADNLDGLNVHFAIVDELHAHKTRALYDVLETAMGARTQPILWMITTAGFDLSGICYEVRNYLRKILEGVHKDDTFFGMIFTIDKDDEWDDPEAWAKANPNLGKGLSLNYLRSMAIKAKATPTAMNNFLTKHLNVWCRAGDQFFSLKHWDNCEKREIDFDDYIGCPMFLAVDAASKIDMAALVAFIETPDGTLILPKFYLPEDTIHTSGNSQYEGWVKEGYLTETPGEVIDQDWIIKDALELISKYQLRAFSKDPFQLTKFSTDIEKHGIEMVEYKQSTLNLSEPMREFDANIREQKIIHDGNPILKWMISNVVAKEDANENVFPRKEVPQNKIDGAVCCIMNTGLQMSGEYESSFEDHGIEFI